MGGAKVEEEGKGDAAEGTTFYELCKMILAVGSLEACRKGDRFACLPRQSRMLIPLMACVVNRCRKSRILEPAVRVYVCAFYFKQMATQSTCKST
jgi:hypothetical protein